MLELTVTLWVGVVAVAAGVGSVRGTFPAANAVGGASTALIGITLPCTPKENNASNNNCTRMHC